MAITAQDVNKLRKMTGVGMMDCKKALTETNGDFEQAIEILRKKGQKVSAKRAGKEAKEGSVFIHINDDNSECTLIAVNCETDFVAKNQEFVNLGQAILDTAVSEKPDSIETLKAAKSGDLTIEEKIMEFVGKIGEKIEISSFEALSGEKVVSYIHANNKLGVLVALKNVTNGDVIEAGKDVAMQIAAMNPIAVDKDDVDPSVIEKEIEIGKEQAIQLGKPAELAEKIAQGKLNKFFKDNTLLNQQFVKDSSLTIAKYLDSVQSGLTVADFKRVQIG